ncbi:MAG: hypothetical protein OEZ65_10295 [Gemmatimonadota bacterium]|nr:hypothetical protein [Gemmatimonadota bacterium]MDH5759968.1 hypothetical protein [Gemmatimonadota bacterium]
MEKLSRDVRFLKLYALGMTACFAVTMLSGFTSQNARQSFAEIDVERINIVESDGTLRMVISNQERQHPGIVNGKVIEREYPRPPGMIFFNQLGDEMGGLIFGANGETGHFGSLTWDKVRNDQTIGFRHMEGDDGAYSTGLEMWQRSNIPLDATMARYDSAMALSDPAAREAAVETLRDAGELGTRRLFFGKGRDDAMLLDMRDIQGRTRLRISVTPDGRAALEFLDDAGEVVYRLPEA